MFPTLESALAGAILPNGTTSLIQGPAIQEIVYEGAEVDFGGAIVGELALTLWNLNRKDAVPKAAEISFRCKLNDGIMPSTAALGAYRLFIGMQTALFEMTEKRELSKTLLALPKRIGAP